MQQCTKIRSLLLGSGFLISRRLLCRWCQSSDGAKLKPWCRRYNHACRQDLASTKRLTQTHKEVNWDQLAGSCCDPPALFRRGSAIAYNMKFSIFSTWCWTSKKWDNSTNLRFTTHAPTWEDLLSNDYSSTYSESSAPTGNREVQHIPKAIH